MIDKQRIRVRWLSILAVPAIMLAMTFSGNTAFAGKLSDTSQAGRTGSGQAAVSNTAGLPGPSAPFAPNAATPTSANYTFGTVTTGSLTDMSTGTTQIV